MEKFDLNKMKGGWFIGNFEPTLFNTTDVEVAVKKYSKGAYESRHFHKVATEFTVIVNGVVRMSGVEYSSGSILKIQPFEATDFEALTDVTTVVVKLPGANNDKYTDL
ncbi:hypothetical protein [Desertivirga xinjiangensis]|uniref:hypothetical protein n=1 Tax=Desertivirga xinjiangensis TaxID=539206 RepID=UPI00210E0701|nr:hypothetical protein [Pedobacter xinjiangensis]